MNRRWGRLARAGFVVLALVAGKELATALPDQDVSLRPFEVAGELGTPVELRTGTVEVREVQLNQTVITPTAGYRTPGLWVAVSTRLTPAQEKETFAYAAVRSEDGRRVWEGRTRSSLSCPTPPPGVPVTCDLLFEVPPEALVGADLLVSTEADQRHDSLAVIDLAITAEQVERAQAQDEPVETREALVGGGDD
ncbi:hypothetical protein MWU75_10630 [Ornithinimicrobium sp. F0845]|uniref:hypothetical protein n=1 Tax=Ornithinimicrobium sp. F0845 TaxID=2926412 RepID=UPI001FF412AE|nr:hypothetical protein [Ornithinimicrobium sp. F0845]MCK0112595.1 hypothetical protein [Ornithinimicrobium sp. F0845]